MLVRLACVGSHKVIETIEAGHCWVSALVPRVLSKSPKLSGTDLMLAKTFYMRHSRRSSVEIA
jgi:hypothetical protein